MICWSAWKGAEREIRDGVVVLVFVGPSTLAIDDGKDDVVSTGWQ